MERQTLINRALERFHQLYGAAPTMAFRAPARINILGEHVDYVRYLPTASLPFGSKEHEMVMVFRAADDALVRGASMSAGFSSFEFSLPDEPMAGASWEHHIFNRPSPTPHWGNYVKGAAYYAGLKYGAAIHHGIEFLVASTIPANSGASSSSALVVLAGAALRRANEIEISLEKLALESSEAEWYLGTRGGALDHTAICLAREGRLVHITHSDQKTSLIPLNDDELRWTTFFTTPAAKGSEVMLAYNERAAVSRLIIPALLEKAHHMQSESIDPVDQLPAEITLAEFKRIAPESYFDCERAFPALVRERHSTPFKIRDRARHHLGETTRVAAAVRAARGAAASGEHLAKTLGRLINESHASLRDLYEVSTPEVERLLKIVRNDPEVYGARLMGGGFGGNILALTTAKNTQSLVERVQSQFYSPLGRDAMREGAVMISTPGDGLRSIAL
jgi:galactokinase